MEYNSALKMTHPKLYYLWINFIIKIWNEKRQTVEENIHYAAIYIMIGSMQKPSVV